MDTLGVVTTEVKVAIAINAFLFFGMALYFKQRPPKKINYLYGYRTRRSMANDTIWKEANHYSASSFLKLSIILVITGLLFILLEIPYGLLIHIGILLVGLGIVVYTTEHYLNTYFDKNGNRKT